MLNRFRRMLCRATSWATACRSREHRPPSQLRTVTKTCSNSLSLRLRALHYDFGPIVNKIISSNTDEFMGGGHYSDGATLARQMHDQKAQMKFVSIPGGARRRQVCQAWSGCPGRDRAVAMVIALGDG